MDDDELRQQIVRLEEQIEALAQTIEQCRKLILISKGAIIVGAILLGAIVLGLIRFNPVVAIGAFAAIFAGAVGFGSNASTSEEATAQMHVAEASRTELIGRIELRVVGSPEDENGA